MCFWSWWVGWDDSNDYDDDEEEENVDVSSY